MGRVNSCVNPHADVDVSGWSGDGTLSRITGATGFPKSTASNIVGATFISTARGAVTANQEHTLSAFIKNSVSANLVLFIDWRDSGSSNIYYYQEPIEPAVSAGVVTRVSTHAIAPSNAAFGALLIRLNNFNPADAQVAGVLIEAGAVLGTYKDGDSAKWSWSGTPGLSASSGSAAVLPQRDFTDTSRRGLQRRWLPTF